MCFRPFGDVFGFRFSVIFAINLISISIMGRWNFKRYLAVLELIITKGEGHFDTFTGPMLFCGYIYRYILMKCCMPACIFILYPRYRSAADGSAVSYFFTHFRPCGVDLQIFFTENFNFVMTSYIAKF